MSRSADPRLPVAGRCAPPRPLRRLSRDLLALVALKLALLALLGWLVVASQPKPDTGPQAITQHLAPTSPAPEARP